LVLSSLVFSFLGVKDTRSNISEAAPKNCGQSDRDAQKDLPKKWRIRPLRYRTDGNRRYAARERVTSCGRSGARNLPMCRRTDRLRSQQGIAPFSGPAASIPNLAFVFWSGTGCSLTGLFFLSGCSFMKPSMTCIAHHIGCRRNLNKFVTSRVGARDSLPRINGARALLRRREGDWQA
jgi:hypothetical protein